MIQRAAGVDLLGHHARLERQAHQQVVTERKSCQGRVEGTRALVDRAGEADIRVKSGEHKVGDAGSLWCWLDAGGEAEVRHGHWHVPKHPLHACLRIGQRGPLHAKRTDTERTVAASRGGERKDAQLPVCGVLRRAKTKACGIKIPDDDPTGEQRKHIDVHVHRVQRRNLPGGPIPSRGSQPNAGEACATPAGPSESRDGDRAPDGGGEDRLESYAHHAAVGEKACGGQNRCHQRDGDAAASQQQPPKVALEVQARHNPFLKGQLGAGIRSHRGRAMVILRMVSHLRMLLATAPPSGADVSFGVSAVAMAVILMIAVVGAIMLAIAARRTAIGGRDSRAHLRTSLDRLGKAGEAPADAWSEAGRRMPVPPREEDRT